MHDMSRKTTHMENIISNWNENWRPYLYVDLGLCNYYCEFRMHN